jgi:hypothetical protein
MQLSGTVVNQANGQPLANVTIWEISPDGQAAQVIGFSGSVGTYAVNLNNAGSTVNFVKDGYQGVTIPGSQALLSDQVLLAPDAAITAKISFAGLPSWVWFLVGGILIFSVSDKKKRK